MEGQIMPIQLPRTVDPQFASTPLIFFRAVLRQTKARSFLKRIITVTPRGMLYVCAGDARVTRSFFLGAVMRVRLDKPFLAIIGTREPTLARSGVAVAQQHAHEDDDAVGGGSDDDRNCPRLVFNFNVLDDSSHQSSTFNHFLEIVRFFAPRAEFIPDARLHSSWEPLIANTALGAVDNMLNGKGVAAISEGLKSMKRVVTEMRARQGEEALGEEDDDAMVPFRPVYNGDVTDGGARDDVESTASAIRLELPVKAWAPLSPTQPSPPAQPALPPASSQPPPLSPKPAAARKAAPLAAVAPQQQYFTPSAQLAELLSKRVRQRIPGIRADRDFLAMMAFHFVGDVQPLGKPLPTSALDAAPMVGTALLTVAPTGIANVWCDARAVCTFDCSRGAITQIEVLSATVARLSCAFPGSSGTWSVAFRDMKSVDDFVRAVVNSSLSTKVVITEPPKAAAAAAPPSPGSVAASFDARNSPLAQPAMPPGNASFVSGRSDAAASLQQQQEGDEYGTMFDGLVSIAKRLVAPPRTDIAPLEDEDDDAGDAAEKERALAYRRNAERQLVLAQLIGHICDQQRRRRHEAELDRIQRTFAPQLCLSRK